MNHIFISYKSEDKLIANRLRQALFLSTERVVWWDQDIQTGGRWNQQIDEALVTAECVVVLWSKRSVQSSWVLQEATIGKSKDILVPVRIDDCEIPAAFTEIQAVNLINWDGDEKDSNFRTLVEGVLNRIYHTQARTPSSKANLEWKTAPQKSLGIGLIGGDGTGKTTLVNSLRSLYRQDLRFISEVSRNVIAKGYPLGKNAHPDSYIMLMHDQLREMYSMVQNKTPFISDRTLLDQLCYSRVNSTLPRPMVPSILISLMEYVWLLEREYYAFYFYFPIEFSTIEDDGVRETDCEYQRQVDKEFVRLIENNNIPFITITGERNERIACAKAAIDRHLLHFRR